MKNQTKRRLIIGLSSFLLVCIVVLLAVTYLKITGLAVLETQNTASSANDSGDYFDWNVRLDRHEKPAGIFQTTPFPINENSTSYTIRNDEYPNGKTYFLGTKYYVDGGFNGPIYAGNWTNPWKNITHALSQVSAGNKTIIVRGAHDSFNGVYNEFGLQPKSGINDINRFMIVGYGQERPIINGSDTGSSSIEGPNALNLSYVSVQRIKVENNFRQGIYMKSSNSFINVVDVWLYNNDKYDFDTSQVWGDGNLYFLGSDNTWIFHITSEHTYGHCIKVGDGADNATIEWSLVKECGYWNGFPFSAFYGSHAAGLDFPNAGVGGNDSDRDWNLIARYNIANTTLFEGAQLRRTSNFSFHHNEIYGSMHVLDFSDGESHSETGNPQVDLHEIGTYGNLYSNIIRNPATNNSVNLKVSTPNSNWENISIFNNLLYGGSQASFFVYGSSTVNTSVNFYSNSLFGNNSASIIDADLVGYPYNLTLMNNIVYQIGAGFAIDPCTQRDSTCTRQPEHNYNLYYAPNGGVSRSGNFVLNTNELNANPLWMKLPNGGYDNNNMALSSSSPAINNGASLSSYFTTDFNGISRPQGSAWNIGAYEYTNGTITPINGQCGTLNNACLTGVLNDLGDNATSYLWQCLGSNGGTNEDCNLIIPITSPVDSGSSGGDGGDGRAMTATTASNATNVSSGAIERNETKQEDKQTEASSNNNENSIKSSSFVSPLINYLVIFALAVIFAITIVWILIARKAKTARTLNGLVNQDTSNAKYTVNTES